jgi:hypothetical protein
MIPISVPETSILFRARTIKWYYRLRNTKDGMVRWDKSSDNKNWSAAESVPLYVSIEAAFHLAARHSGSNVNGTPSQVC